MLFRSISLENARDRVRRLLNQSNPQAFPYGRIGTDIGDLCNAIFSSRHNVVSSQLVCNQCNLDPQQQPTTSHMEVVSSTKSISLKQIIRSSQDQATQIPCGTCQTQCRLIRRYNNTPPILAFNLQSSTIKISKKITLKLDNSTSSNLVLRGIIYLGERHFIIRYIDNDRKVWFHDGITTGEKCEMACCLSNLTEIDLKKFKNAIAVMAIYTAI